MKCVLGKTYQIIFKATCNQSQIGFRRIIACRNETISIFATVVKSSGSYSRIYSGINKFLLLFK